MSHHHHSDKPELDAILRREDEILDELEEIEHELHHPNITHFTSITETTMTPLAAGQTATFSTTAVPAGTAPDPSKITWSSSDTTNAPVSPNTADASGLSTLVTFPTGTPEGLTFILTINYLNPDGKAVSQANSFVTVAAPPLDIVSFTDIVQTN